MDEEIINEKDFKSKKLLSLCMPTNGVLEWVIPSLNSIYSQGVNEDDFEVIVSDNGTDKDFFFTLTDYASKHKNLIYRRTDAKQFNNLIECFRPAAGELLKFINHRSILEPGTIQYLIDFAIKYKDQKPCLYFNNGSKGKNAKGIHEYETFDEYIKEVGLNTSWTTGYAFWKEDLDWLNDNPKLNYFAPNLDLIFHDRHRGLYVVDNMKLMHDLPTDETKKGKYNLYKYWALEYPNAILQLLVDGDITPETYRFVKKEIENFNVSLYVDYNILKHKCSYDVRDFDRYIDVIFNKNKIQRLAMIKLLKRAIKVPLSSVKHRIIR